MKYFVFVMLMLPLSSYGQLEMIKESSSYFDPIDSTYNLYFSVYNFGEEDALFYWALETKPEEPELWKRTQFYDLNICYSDLLSSCPCGFSNFVAAGDTSQLFTTIIEIEQGFDKGSITWRLLNDCLENATDTLAELSCKFGEIISYDQDIPIESSQVKLYPNPTSDLFTISNDTNVSSMEILNLSGQSVRKFMHLPSSNHDVSDLQSGCYLLLLKDKLGRTLQLKKLVKN